jgi:hypothetical protein
VAVSALNQDDVEAYGIGVSVGGNTGFQFSVVVDVYNSYTDAYIADNSQVNQDRSAVDNDQSVLVAAGNDYYHLGVAGVLSGSGSFAATPGVDVAVTDINTHAYIGAAALVDASSDVEVRANSAEDMLEIAAAVAGSGTGSGAGAGAVTVLNLDSETHAYIDNGAAVDVGGNVLVSAADATDVDVVAGALSATGGVVGFGVGVGVSTILKDTQAFIDDGAFVDAKGNSSTMTVFDGSLAIDGTFGTYATARGVAVTAVSSEDVLIVGAAGAFAISGAGSGALAGAISVETIDSDTKAYIGADAVINGQNGGGTGVNDLQDVTVSAINDVNVTVVTGAVSGALYGTINGGVDVGSVRNDTTAYISGNAQAKHDVRVHALADRDIDTKVYSVAIGIANLQAAVSVWGLAGNLESTYTANGSSDDALEDQGQTAGGYADAQLSRVKDLLNGYAAADSEAGADNSADVAATADSVNDDVNATADSAANTQETINADVANETRTVPRGTSAFIGANALINVGNNVDIDARERVHLDMDAGAGNLSAGAGGAAVIVATLDTKVDAFIGDGATVTAGAAGIISVDADLRHEVDGLSVSATIAGGALIAAVAVVDDHGKSAAYLDSNSTNSTHIPQAGNVVVKAKSDQAIKLETGEGALAGFAAGASVAVARVEEGSTKAYVGQNVRIGQTNGQSVGTLNVIADADADLVADAYAVSLGVATGSGSDARAIYLPTISAYVDDDAQITLSGDLAIRSKSFATTAADALGVNVALGLTVGVSLAESEVSPHLRSSLGSGTVSANNVIVESLHNNAQEFDPSIAVGNILHTVDFGYRHGFSTGQKVTYSHGGGAAIGSLSDGEDYYVIYVNETTVNLASSLSSARSGNALPISNSGAAGTAHSLRSGKAIADANSSSGSLQVGIDSTELDATIDPTINTYIGSETTPNSHLQLTALGDVVVRTQSYGETSGISLGVTIGGLVGVGVVDSDSHSRGTFSTRVSSGAAISAANLTVQTQSVDDAYAEAEGGSGSIGVAVGAATADATGRSHVTSFIGRDSLAIGSTSSPTTKWLPNQNYSGVTQVSTTGSGVGITVNISTDSLGEPTVVLASNAGDGYANGDFVAFADPSGTGDHIAVVIVGGINVAGDVIVSSTVTPQLQAKTYSVNIGGLVEVGSNESLTSAFPIINAYVDAHYLTAGNLTISATQAKPVSARSGKTESFSAGGSVVVGVNAVDSFVYNTAEINSYIADNSNIRVFDKTQIISTSHVDQFAYGTGVGVGGVVGVGSTNTDTRSATTNNAYLGENVKLRGGFLFDPATDVDSANDVIDLGFEHGLANGAAVTYDHGGGSVIGGLNQGNTYYARVISPTELQLTITKTDAVATNPVVINLDNVTAVGRDHRITPVTVAIGGLVFDPTLPSVVNDAENTIDFGTPHTLTDGDSLIYTNGGGTSIGGLNNGGTFYADVQDDTRIKLKERLAFDPRDPKVEDDNEITITDHRLSPNQSVVYRDSELGRLGNLTSGNTYYVIVVDVNTVKLSETLGGAEVDILSFTVTASNQQLATLTETLHTLERTVDLDPTVATSAPHRLTLNQTADINQLVPGTLVISAIGHDENRADAIAGVGSLVASFAAADSDTESDGSATAEIRDSNATGGIRVASLRISANHTTTFNYHVDGESISVLGSGSYPSGDNDHTGDAVVRIGEGVDIVTGSLRATAKNTMHKPLIDDDNNLVGGPGRYNQNVEAVGGGIIASYADAGGTSTTHGTAIVLVGDQARLAVIGDDGIRVTLCSRRKTSSHCSTSRLWMSERPCRLPTRLRRSTALRMPPSWFKMQRWMPWVIFG